MTVGTPALWSPEQPALYTLDTAISSQAAIVDTCETWFGIRSVGFDADCGFLLNGENIKLKRVNEHHDELGVHRCDQRDRVGGGTYRCGEDSSIDGALFFPEAETGDDAGLPRRGEQQQSYPGRIEQQMHRDDGGTGNVERDQPVHGLRQSVWEDVQQQSAERASPHSVHLHLHRMATTASATNTFFPE